MRERLPDVRQSLTHKFIIHSDPPTKFYVTAGLFENGSPGEVFVTMEDMESGIHGLMNIIAILISLCLQSGVPLEKLIEKLSWQSFAPQGFTDDPEIKYANSMPDAIIRWMEQRFSPKKAETL